MNQDMHTAYKANQSNTEGVRDTEARALLSCASRLEEARAGDTSRQEFGDAIRKNQKLWTIFQVSLCEPDNQLPRDLKILLLNLSRYVDKVSFRAISEENPDLLRSLININRTIAAGLSKKPETGATTQTTSSLSGQPKQGETLSVTTLA